MTTVGYDLCALKRCYLGPCMCHKVHTRMPGDIPGQKGEADNEPSWVEKMLAIEEQALGKKFVPLQLKRSM